MLSSWFQWCQSLRFLNLQGWDSWPQDLFDEKRSEVWGSLLFPKLCYPSCLYTPFCWRTPIWPEVSPPLSSLLHLVQVGVTTTAGPPRRAQVSGSSGSSNSCWLEQPAELKYLLSFYPNMPKKDRFWSIPCSTLNWAALQYLCSNTFFSGGKLFYVSSSIRAVCVLWVLSPVDLGSAFHRLCSLRLLHLNASSSIQWL